MDMPNAIGKFFSGLKEKFDPSNKQEAKVEPQPQEMPEADDSRAVVMRYIEENRACEEKISVEIDQLRDKLPKLTGSAERAQQLDAKLATIQQSLAEPKDIPADMSGFNELALGVVKDMTTVIGSADVEESKDGKGVFSVDQCMELLETALCKERRSENPLEVSIAKNRLILIQDGAKLATNIKQLEEQKGKRKEYRSKIRELEDRHPDEDYTGADAVAYKNYSLLLTEVNQFMETVEVMVAQLKADIEKGKNSIDQSVSRLGQSSVNAQTIADAIRELEEENEKAMNERLEAIAEAELKNARQLAKLKATEEKMRDIVPVVNSDFLRNTAIQMEESEEQTVPDETLAQPAEELADGELIEE